VTGAGKRDKLVTIQTATDGVDGTGAPQQTWATLGTAWMHRRRPSGNEVFTADQVTAPERAEWEMVYQANMDPESVDVTKLRRLAYQGWTYDIYAAYRMDRSEGMAIVLSTLGRSAA
jgi:SPP1 family predicted phage head-tail adaptor